MKRVQKATLFYRFLMRLGREGLGILFCVVVCYGYGCKTSSQYYQEAREESFALVQEGRTNVFGEGSKRGLLENLQMRSNREQAPEKVIENRMNLSTNIIVINSPVEALQIAFQNNPDYQRNKEDLILAALNVSDARHRFEGIFGHETQGTLSRTSSDRFRGNVNNKITFSQLLATGATIGVSIVNDLFRFFTGPSERSASSVVSVNIFQPLLRGAGSEVVLENLKQTERNLIYAIRSFDYYQVSFAVDVITRYFQLLQLQDEVSNNYNNYQNLVLARERAEALSKDRLPAFQVDQTRQSELLARDRYLNAIERYRSEMDSFKQLLGLGLDQPIQLERAALEKLREESIGSVPFDPLILFGVALRRRLDFLNEVDRYDDARRKISIAENDLLANLDFSANVSVGSIGGTDWDKLDWKTWTGSAGLKLKLPVDKITERNQLYNRYILFERQHRNLETTIDRLKNQIRTSARRLQQKATSYEIQKNAVELARRRVESADLLLRAGRATTRDLLDAQDDLLTAENALTRNLVEYYIAKLQLLRDTGLLYIEDNQIVENKSLLEELTQKMRSQNKEEQTQQRIPLPQEVYVY